MFASSLCIFVCDGSWSFAVVQFVLEHQRVMICGRSGPFARCRAICCDSVATALRRQTRRDRKWVSGSGSTREAIALTQRSIDALRPAEAAYRVPDQRCTGLAVRVAPSGIKTWDLAYRIRNSGKTRRLSLGRVADVALEKARERANALTSAARTGRDLITEEEERQRLLPPG